MVPPAPAFTGGLRLARVSDISRIGVVAASAFYHSSWFAYERPYYEKYPLDTLSSYRNSFSKAVLDPNAAVLVVEDTLDKHESSKVYNALASVYPAFEEQIPGDILDRGRAIVSIASFSLLSNSSREGQFQPEGVINNVGPDAHTPNDIVRNQDKDPRGGENMDKVLHPEEVEAFKSRMVIDMMITYPAYWKKGHASLISKWFVDLAKIDQVGLGVAAAPMGKVFFKSIGFHEVKEVEIPGYEVHPKPIYAWLGHLDPLRNAEL